MDVVAWLRSLGLEAYAESFAEQAIDGDVLPSLSDADLRELGVDKLGHRKKLLAAIAALDTAGVAGESRPVEDDAPEAPRPAEDERRQVTVLFADLAGYTRLSTELDAEDLRILMDRVFAVLDAAVESHGGVVDKHIGDAVMALFGAPVAHHDDPERAVRAALAMHRNIARLSEEVDRPMALHVGIACGDVVAGNVGGGEYTVVGDSVNLASRLESLAEAGSTLISEPVHDALAGRLACAALGEVRVQGIDAPVPVWRVSDQNQAVPAARDTRFIGRRSELHQFQGMLDVCRDQGQGQTLILRGEAGIGKTRLTEEFAGTAAERDFAVHRGLVLDFGAGRGQDAIRSLVRSLLDLAGDADEESRSAGAVRAMRDGAVSDDDLVFLNDLLDLSQPPAQRALYDAMEPDTRNAGKRAVLGGLVRGAAAVRPVLLVVEDAHWGSRLLLEHLASLTGVVQECPAMLVMTTRVEGDPFDLDWRAETGGATVTTLDLAPLRQAEAAELAGEIVGVASEVARACIERAGGNPLFLEQLLRNMVDSHDAAVPATVKSLVQARLDRLAGSDRRAMQAAAAIGQRFDPACVRFLIDEPAYDFMPLVRAYLIRREGEEFLFGHALIRDAVYAGLLKSRARTLHGRAAEWFVARDPVLHALHLERAGDPAAAGAYLAAAQAQSAAYRVESALALVEQGLGVAREDRDRVQLNLEKGDLLRSAGAIADSLAAFETALGQAAEPLDRCRARIGLAAGMRLTDQLDDALAQLDEAETEVGDSRRHRARICILRGNLYFPMGNTEGGRKANEEALALARQIPSDDLEARALSGLADVAYASSRMATAFGYFRDCVALAERAGLGRIEVPNRSMMGFSRHYLNEHDHAVADGRAAARMAAQVGDLRGELLGRMCVVLVALDRGEAEETDSMLIRSQDLARILGAGRFEAQNVLLYATAAYQAGDTAGANELARKAWQLCKSSDPRFIGPRTLALVALTCRDEADAWSTLAEAEALLREGVVGHNHLWFYRWAIETALERGAWDKARTWADRCERHTAAEPLPWSDLAIERGRALADWGEAGPSEAGRARLETVAELIRTAQVGSLLPRVEAALSEAS